MQLSSLDCPTRVFSQTGCPGCSGSTGFRCSAHHLLPRWSPEPTLFLQVITLRQSLLLCIAPSDGAAMTVDAIKRWLVIQTTPPFHTCRSQWSLCSTPPRQTPMSPPIPSHAGHSWQLNTWTKAPSSSIPSLRVKTLNKHQVLIN